MAAAVAVAAAAAIAFGWSTALMHHGASTAPGGVRTADLLRHVVAQWRWLVGMAASLTGLALHALALHLGSLALVQPVVVTGLIFSIVFREALDGRLPSRRVMGWVSITGVGLVLLVSASSSARVAGTSDGSAAAVILVVGAVTAVLLTSFAGRKATSRAGLLLGAAAGVVFGLIAGALKATTEAASNHELLSSWPLYVLVPLGASGFLLNQRAYHQAPLSSSIPALNTINPLVAVAFGILVFHEHPARSVLAVVAECAGLALVLAGIFFLARSEAP
ncbi:MAG: hypothetical protein QOF76_5134 [Solirubrobacteraceae bacterium]|jgi:hypothetical protein|nr:hypothetical protein [Solirubrobacteraceae bacterium]